MCFSKIRLPKTNASTKSLFKKMPCPPLGAVVVLLCQCLLAPETRDIRSGWGLSKNTPCILGNFNHLSSHGPSASSREGGKRQVSGGAAGSGESPTKTKLVTADVTLLGCSALACCLCLLKMMSARMQG